MLHRRPGDRQVALNRLAWTSNHPYQRQGTVHDHLSSPMRSWQCDQSIVVITRQSRAVDSVHIRPSACPPRVRITTFCFGCSPSGEIARVMQIDPESNIETVRGVRFRTMFLKCGQEGPTLTWAASDICLQIKTFFPRIIRKRTCKSKDG